MELANSCNMRTTKLGFLIAGLLGGCYASTGLSSYIKTFLSEHWLLLTVIYLAIGAINSLASLYDHRDGRTPESRARQMFLWITLWPMLWVWGVFIKIFSFFHLGKNHSQYVPTHR